jgi:hypothetical protein
MRRFGLSDLVWKWVLSAGVMLAAVVLVGEFGYAIKPLADGEHGTLGYRFFWNEYSRGTSTLLGLDANSPLVPLGAAGGDTIVLDRFDDDNTNGLRPGAPIGLTLVHQGVATHHIVPAVASPNSTTFELRYVVAQIGRVLCLLFALLIGFKGAGSPVYRTLALYFLMCGFNERPVFLPAGELRSVCEFLYWSTFIPASYFVLKFAVQYPNGQPTGLRGLIARHMRAIGAAAVLMNGYMLWWATGHAAPYCYFIATAFVGPMTVALLATLVDGWRNSIGADRQRHIWLLVAIGSSNFFSLLTGLPIEWRIGDVRVVHILGDASTLFMDIGIAYAVLRHRVFNFSFAINRAIFYSATSVILLVAFGIVEWLSEHFLHFEAREANVLIDGGIALAVYLAFHKIKHAFEHALERLFFHKWHQNDAALRQFIKKAAHISATDDLIASFHAELTRFSGGASCAIYQKNAAGDYDAMKFSDGGLAARIGKDDDISVSLRAEQAPLSVADTHPLHARKLALPMDHRGALNGFVLLGTKPSGDDYRPDEIAGLGFAAHQIGLDLHALQIECLTSAVDGQAKRIALDSVKITEQEKTIDRMQELLLNMSGNATRGSCSTACATALASSGSCSCRSRSG